ncbi:hypothetical protein SNE40_012208 [Patella caerulea]|uniref:Receptor ligand binding region domain-containing protein n=1 Tax=Patella caerulea TaxID=87958 RepID=A0AAN8Q037_PATCE
MCRLIVDVVLVITCVCQVTCRHPVVNIGAVFADAEYEQFQRTFYAAISDFNNSSERLKMYGKAMVAQGDFYDTVTSMCSMLESRSFHLLIVFGNTTTVHSVNVMAQYLDIPVIGYSRQADDEYFQVSPNSLTFC